jgi:hypothetical protein
MALLCPLLSVDTEDITELERQPSQEMYRGIFAVQTLYVGEYVRQSEVCNP